MSEVINLIPWSIHGAFKGKENVTFLHSLLYPYISFSGLKSAHKAFAMSFYSLLQLSSSCLPLARNSGTADLFTRRRQLRYPDFHHILSNQTKQRILSYQFGSRMWIYFAILVNSATLWKRDRDRESAREKLQPRECQISLIDRVGNIEGHVRCISLLGSITRVDTLLRAEMTVEKEEGFYDIRSWWELLIHNSISWPGLLRSYTDIINFWVLGFSYFMDVLESVHFQDRDTYEVKLT